MKVTKGIDDVQTTHPFVVREWHEGNLILPESIRANSCTSVKWKCSHCNQEWYAIVRERALHHARCVCGTKFIDYDSSLEYNIDKIPDTLSTIAYRIIGNHRKEILNCRDKIVVINGHVIDFTITYRDILDMFFLDIKARNRKLYQALINEKNKVYTEKPKQRDKEISRLKLAELYVRANNRHKQIELIKYILKSGGYPDDYIRVKLLGD
jgi:hypothetical protein